MGDTPMLPVADRFHVCVICAVRGTPWAGRRGDHESHDEFDLVGRIGANIPSVEDDT